MRAQYKTAIGANPDLAAMNLMRKFSWQTMLIFVISLLLAVILLGLGTAHISKLKQQRRQLSDNSAFDCVGVETRPNRPGALDAPGPRHVSRGLPCAKAAPKTRANVVGGLPSVIRETPRYPGSYPRRIVLNARDDLKRIVPVPLQTKLQLNHLTKEDLICEN